MNDKPKAHKQFTNARTRRALEAGLTPEEIRHAVALSVATLGMPNAIAAYTWVNDIPDA